jgi:hypothetical protein
MGTVEKALKPQMTLLKKLTTKDTKIHKGMEEKFKL